MAASSQKPKEQEQRGPRGQVAREPGARSQGDRGQEPGSLGPRSHGARAREPRGRSAQEKNNRGPRIVLNVKFCGLKLQLGAHEDTPMILVKNQCVKSFMDRYDRAPPSVPFKCNGQPVHDEDFAGQYVGYTIEGQQSTQDKTLFQELQEDIAQEGENYDEDEVSDGEEDYTDNEQDYEQDKVSQ